MEDAMINKEARLMWLNGKCSCWAPCFAVLASLFLAVGCSAPEGNTADGSTSDGGTDYPTPDLLYQPNQLPGPYALITEPTGNASYTTNAANVTIGGPGFADSVTWTTNNGTTGSIAADGHWQAEITLEPGDNKVTVVPRTGDTEGAGDSITITRNPLSFSQPLSANPSEVFVDTPTDVVFSTRLQYDEALDAVAVASGMSSVNPQLIEVDEDDQPIMTLCTLEDSGQASAGDEWIGDLVYSCKVNIDEAQPGALRLRVRIDTQGDDGPEVTQGEVLSLPVIQPLSQAEADRIDSLGQEALAKFNDLINADGQIEGAQETAAWLETQSDVPYAKAADDGYTVSWEVAISGGRTIQTGLGGGPPDTHGDPVLQIPSALLLEPFYMEWAAYEGQLSDDMKDMLDKPLCPKLNPIDVRHEGASAPADVAGFKKMGDYGIVVIWSHGGLWKGKTPATNWSAIITDEIAYPHDMIQVPGYTGKYAADIATQRLTTWSFPDGQHYAITHKFIDDYVNFNQAIVFNGACHGFSDLDNVTSPLYRSFLKKGAAVFISFHGPVDTIWSKLWAKAYFMNLIYDFDTVSKAFNDAVALVGETDPTKPDEDVYVHAMYRTPADMQMTINWGCDGYFHVVTTTDTATWNFDGQYKLRETSPRQFGLDERRSYCKYTEKVFSEIQTPVTDTRKNRDWRTGQGSLEESFPEPFTTLLSISDDGSWLDLGQMEPNQGDWVHVYYEYARQMGNGDFYYNALEEATDCGPWNGNYHFEDGGNISITDEAARGQSTENNGVTTADIDFYFRLK
jgi:hypothetical protein